MPYETILTFHIASFIWNISWVILADSVGLLWVFGKLKRLPEKFVILAHKLIWLGIIVSITTGLFMFWELRDYLLATPAFYTKMLFILALMVNATFISKHLTVALEVGKFRDLTSKQKRNFLVSGLISTFSWLVVFVSAKMLGL